LTDGINYKQTVSKVQIPISISQALPEFILRATKYYSVAPANVQIGGTV